MKVPLKSSGLCCGILGGLLMVSSALALPVVSTHDLSYRTLVNAGQPHAVITTDERVGGYQLSPAKVTHSRRSSETSPAMDVDYRTIEIPDDFVVLVGDTSTPLKPDAPERMTNEVPTVDESGVLIQQEFVSLKEVSSTKLPKAETLQPSSAVNHRLMMLRDTDSTHLTDNEIQPDPQPNTPIINASTKSPLTGVRHPVTASARPNNALTSYRTLTKADFNPFSTLVSWQFVPGTNVGEAVRRLATFIGYRVVVPSPQVNAIYAMPLPYIHRQVKHLKVQTAFEVIGGDGMFVVVDHRTREIAHHIKSLGETAATLPGCFELGFVEWESTTTGYCPVRDKRCRL